MFRVGKGPERWLLERSKSWMLGKEKICEGNVPEKLFEARSTERRVVMETRFSAGRGEDMELKRRKR